MSEKTELKEILSNFTWFCIIAGLIFYMPFILFGILFGLDNTKVIYFVLCLIVYTRLLLPIVINKILNYIIVDEKKLEDVEETNCGIRR